MIEYKIRFAKKSDIKSIISLMKPYNMHHIPSLEMGELNEQFFIVAEYKGNIIGAAGFSFLNSDKGKTTLMAVHPDYQHFGVGKELQRMRMIILAGFGCGTILTNVDRPETVAWYKKNFGYKEIGRLKKIHSFGRKDIDEWTTLEASLKNIKWKINKPEKLIINFAPTGMVSRKKDNPNVPVTATEIARDALKAALKGASIIHIHARDAEESPSPDPKIYSEIILRIRDKRPDLVICVTTGGRNYKDFSKRSASIEITGDAKPDMGSLTIGSLNFPKQAVSNEPDIIMALAKKMLENEIKPELEVFEIGMVDYYKYLFKKGFLKLPLYTNILLGSLGSMNASKQNLEFMLKSLPPFNYWAATGIGKFQGKVHKMAIKKGGGVRVGLEDNIYLDEHKTVLATNMDLIDRVLSYKPENMAIATPREVREWLQL